MVVDNDTCHDEYLNIPNINSLDSSVEKIEFLSSLYNLSFEEIRYTDSIQLTAFKESVLKSLNNPCFLFDISARYIYNDPDM